MTQRGYVQCLAWTLALAAGAMLLPGCGSGGGAGAPAAKKSGRIRLAGIIFQEDDFYRLVQFGMRDAAKAADVELLEGASGNKLDKEIDLINTYIARGVDAILVPPVSRKGSVAALKQAHDKGITLIVHNTPIDADFAAAHIECSPADLGEQTGKAARKYIEEKLGGKAKIAILAFKSQLSEQSDARTGGFKKEVMQLPGVEVVAEQDAWLPELAVSKAGDILTAHPEVDVIYAANEGGTIGSVLAVKNAGKTGKVVVFGTDVNEQLLTFLLSPDNILQAITAQRPVEVGRLAVEYALKALRKEPIETPKYLKGILLSRTDPEGVKDYEKQLKQWMSKG
ncbi:MAG: substrate-binding domain-containing protein [Planctomycetota bacterium]|nr:substrate-binding domain-containing protein [Planctomycetota bacterium]